MREVRELVANQYIVSYTVQTVDGARIKMVRLGSEWQAENSRTMPDFSHIRWLEGVIRRGGKIISMTNRRGKEVDSFHYVMINCAA